MELWDTVAKLSHLREEKDLPKSRARNREKFAKMKITPAERQRDDKAKTAAKKLIFPGFGCVSIAHPSVISQVHDIWICNFRCYVTA